MRMWLWVPLSLVFLGIAGAAGAASVRKGFPLLHFAAAATPATESSQAPAAPGTEPLNREYVPDKPTGQSIGEKGTPAPTDKSGALHSNPSRSLDLVQALEEYAYQSKAVALLEEHRSLLESYADMAQERFKASRGTQHDVFMAQLEALKLLERQIQHEEALHAAQSLVNRLLVRPLATPVEVPSGDPAQPESSWSLEALYQAALNRSGRGGPHGKTGPDSPQRNAAKDARAARSPLYFALEKAYAEATGTQRLLELYKTSLIPLSRAALESALESYQSGATPFQQLLDTVSLSLDAQMRQCRAMADYRKALAQMEALSGIDLTPSKETAHAS